MDSKYSQCLLIRNQARLNLYISYLLIKKTIIRCSELAFMFLCFKNNNYLEGSTSDNTGVNSHLILSQRPHIDPLRNDLLVLSPSSSSSTDDTSLPHQPLSHGLRDLQSEIFVSVSIVCDMIDHGFSVHCQSAIPEIRGLNRQILAYISQQAKRKKAVEIFCFWIF